MNKTLATAFVLSVSAIVLSGCDKTPISKESTDNTEIKYDKLFTRHGCEVGCEVDRFEDSGHRVYIKLCPEEGTSSAQQSYYVSTGKSGYAVRKQSIQVRSPLHTLN